MPSRGARRRHRERGGARHPRAVGPGNNDIASKWDPNEHRRLESLPWEAALSLPGGRLAVTHVHQIESVERRHGWLRERYPDVRVVVYGHTHRRCIDRSARPWIVNPGVAGRNRTFGGPSLVVIDMRRRDRRSAGEAAQGRPPRALATARVARRTRSEPSGGVLVSAAMRRTWRWRTRPSGRAGRASAARRCASSTGARGHRSSTRTAARAAKDASRNTVITRRSNAIGNGTPLHLAMGQPRAGELWIRRIAEIGPAEFRNRRVTG